MTRFLMMVAFLLGISLAHADRGSSVVGSGGSVIRLPDGQVVPADLYFKDRGFRLPDHYLPAMTEKTHPVLFAELKSLRDLLDWADYPTWEKVSEYYPGTTFPDFDAFEIYPTPILSGDDSFDTEDGAIAEPVGFAYHFNQPAQDFSSVKVRRIVEVKSGLFEKLTPRNQALVLVHELFHLSAKLDHTVLSPMIKALSTVASLEDRQKAGDRAPLTPSELEASRNFQNIAFLYSPDLETSRKTLVHSPAGGGFLWGIADVQTSFVSAGSRVWDAFTSYPFEASRLVDSQVIHSYFGLGGGSDCTRASFEYLKPYPATSARWYDYGIGPMIDCRGDSNIFRDISLYSGAWPGLMNVDWTDSQEYYSPWKEEDRPWLDFTGGRNTITIEAFGSRIRVDGYSALMNTSIELGSDSSLLDSSLAGFSIFGANTKIERAKDLRVAGLFGDGTIISNVEQGGIVGEPYTLHEGPRPKQKRYSRLRFENIRLDSRKGASVVLLSSWADGISVTGLKLVAPSNSKEFPRQTFILFHGKNRAFQFDPKRVYRLKKDTPQEIILRKVEDLDSWSE